MIWRFAPDVGNIPTIIAQTICVGTARKEVHGRMMRLRKAERTRPDGDILEDFVVESLSPSLPGGLRKTINSGAKNADGDIEGKYYQFCCKRKRTIGGSSVSKKEWADICRAASRRGRDPVCVRENKQGEILVTLTLEEFRKICQAAFEKERRELLYDGLFKEKD